MAKALAPAAVLKKPAAKERAVKIIKPPALVKVEKPALVIPTPAEAHSLAKFFASELNAIDKKLRLRPGAETTVKPISTGLLCCDWALSGGVRSVFNQVAGFEQAGKTTLTVGVFGGAVKTGVPLISYIDGEGSLTPDYADAVLNSFGLSQVFDQETRRYYSLNVLEQATNQIARMIRRMPDKLLSDEIGSWCYFVPKGQPKWTPLLNAFKELGLKADRAASNEGFWCYPTPYAGAEAAIFVDSWPSLIPEAVDEAIDTEKGTGLGMMARVLAEELPKFAGRLKRKGAVLWSVNQLREKPMAQGNPIYEPGGNALKLYTMVRNQMMVRAVPEGWDRDPDAGGLCIEESVYGDGYDRYAFKSFSNTKNKLGRPFLKTMLRVWTSDSTGVARGYDPVFDAWNYLRTTEQVSGSRKRGFQLRFKPSITGRATQLSGMDLTWMQFKTLLLAEHFNDKELLKSILAELNLKKAPKLREALFEQVAKDKTLWGDQVAAATGSVAVDEASAEAEE